MEKKGRALYPQWLLDGFIVVLAETGLYALELYGHQYTWEKGRGTASWLEIRLDKEMATSSWVDLFPLARLYNLEGTPSNHSPILLRTTTSCLLMGKKWFHFENAWLTEPLCKYIVSDTWEAEVDASLMHKVKTCGDNLSLWGKEVTSCFGKRIKECKFQLKQLRNKRDENSVAEYKVPKKKLFLILDQKEIFWRQRSKQLWLQAGDKNTKYFHGACDYPVLANRMKNMLEKVVSESQSAFIPGRLIFDNIMVSYELIHYLKKKKIGKDGYMALKLDMSKAYDRVEWDFLKAIMRKMGFSDWWIQLVLTCVTTISYSIVHGEVEMGPIHPSHGIRQGDPLSPYLFIIYAEASTDEARRVREFLDVYEQASGQKVNKAKSSIFFSTNVIRYNKEEVCSLLQMSEASEHSTYLGLPNLLGRNKSTLLGYLKERVNARIRTWDGIRWRIGRGDSIQVLDQPWLMEEDNSYITSTSQLLKGKIVDYFLVAGQRQWDVNLVREHFNVRDQGSILNTGLTNSNNEDMIYWRFKESGLYSVKSAYKFLQVQKRQWTLEDGSSIWKSYGASKHPLSL
ncbi:uncharacterized protein LOC141679713 [Apium graveolens]|uniref:uncharacterized protein LOC141679713 n=1 Tax=Apium graveolens TaxID=4045 RepID=UPI003D793EDA